MAERLKPRENRSTISLIRFPPGIERACSSFSRSKRRLGGVAITAEAGEGDCWCYPAGGAGLSLVLGLVDCAYVLVRVDGGAEIVAWFCGCQSAEVFGHGEPVMFGAELDSFAFFGVAAEVDSFSAHPLRFR
jgi:hypothetical protein